jgi:hypothetical protein
MKIEVVTMWYNESFLAPFFFQHYKNVDKITIYYDQDSNDGTYHKIANEIISGQNINVIKFRFPYGLDELIKISFFNQSYQRSIKSNFFYITTYSPRLAKFIVRKFFKNE